MLPPRLSCQKPNRSASTTAFEKAGHYFPTVIPQLKESECALSNPGYLIVTRAHKKREWQDNEHRSIPRTFSISLPKSFQFEILKVCGKNADNFNASCEPGSNTNTHIGNFPQLPRSSRWPLVPTRSLMAWWRKFEKCLRSFAEPISTLARVTARWSGLLHVSSA